MSRASTKLRPQRRCSVPPTCLDLTVHASAPARATRSTCRGTPISMRRCAEAGSELRHKCQSRWEVDANRVRDGRVSERASRLTDAGGRSALIRVHVPGRPQHLVNPFRQRRRPSSERGRDCHPCNLLARFDASRYRKSSDISKPCTGNGCAIFICVCRPTMRFLGIGVRDADIAVWRQDLRHQT